MRPPTISVSAALTIVALTTPPVLPASAPPADIWYKVCTKTALNPSSADVEAGDVCQTIADIRDDKTSVLTGHIAVRQFPGKSGFELEAILPLSSAFPPGVLLKIDDGVPIKLTYQACDSVGCVAKAAVDDGAVAKMKSGKQITSLAIETSGKAVTRPMTLAGFADAIGGPPVAIERYKTDQKKIAELVAKRRAETNKGQPVIAPAKLANAGKNAVLTTGWYKLCQPVNAPSPSKPGDAPANVKTPTVCLTQVDVRDDATMVLAGKIAVRKIEGQNTWQLAAMLPLKVSLPQGAFAAVDNAQPMKLAFTTCDGVGCYALADIPPASLAQLKNSREIVYAGMDGNGDAIVVPISLSGFAAAFEGPPMPMETYNGELRRLAEIIVVRAARQRKQQVH